MAVRCLRASVMGACPLICLTPTRPPPLPPPPKQPSQFLSPLMAPKVPGFFWGEGGTSSIRQLPGAANGTSRHIQHSPDTPTTGLRERGNDTSGSTGRSGRQNAATRRNMRREERVTVQGPVKKQQPVTRGGGSSGNPTYVPQKDPFIALIMLNINMWGQRWRAGWGRSGVTILLMFFMRIPYETPSITSTHT